MKKTIKLITYIIAGSASLSGIAASIFSSSETYAERKPYYILFIISLFLMIITISKLIEFIEEYKMKEIIEECEVIEEIEPMSDFDKCYLIALKNKKGKHE